jgi:hypothetical protein
MTKKEQLYYLLNNYAIQKYDVKTFCQAFQDLFYPDIPRTELTPYELKVFNELGNKVVRYSPYKEDIMNYPRVYFSNEDIDKAISETRIKLINNNK